MKKLRAALYLTFMVMSLVITVSVLCQASQDIPESITFNQLHNLYEPVVFEHQMHAEMFSCGNCHHYLKGLPEEETTCTNCHSQEINQVKGGCNGCHLSLYISTQKNLERAQAFPFYHIDIPTLKGALHLQCAGCHQNDGGPTGCRECHAFTEKGRKRFRAGN